MAYESERAYPKTDQCKCTRGKDSGKDMKLHFDGFYLRLYVGGQVDSAQHARSGLPADDYFDYSVARQREKDQGPIPEGEYWIRPDEVRLEGMANLYTSVEFRRSWGNFRITIHPYPTTDVGPRGGFFIHGGEKFGSKGCIDLAGFMDHFVNRLRELLPTKVDTYQLVSRAPYTRDQDRLVSALTEFSTSCYIPLTVKYARQSADMPPWFNK